MPSYHPDDPIRLTDYRFTTADVLEMSGLLETKLRNWQSRGVVPQVGQRFAGRLMFNLFDAIRFTAIQDLTARTCMPIADAAKVAELIVRKVADFAPDGRADATATPRTLTLVVAFEGGVPMVGLIDSSQPSYGAWFDDWSKPHIAVPIAALVTTTIGKAIGILTAPAAAHAS